MTPRSGWIALAGAGALAVITVRAVAATGEARAMSLGEAIDIVAIHQHMTGEQPRVLFLHYWRVGKAADLAGAVVAAFKETKHDNTP